MFIEEKDLPRPLVKNVLNSSLAEPFRCAQCEDTDHTEERFKCESSVNRSNFKEGARVCK